MKNLIEGIRDCFQACLNWFLRLIMGTVTNVGPTAVVEERNVTIETPSYTVWIPVVLNKKPPRRKIIGAESENTMAVNEKWYNPNTALKYSIRGYDVMAVPGKYDWSISDNKFGSYRPDWITVKMSPEWMLLPDQPLCKLPQKEYWDQYADFIQAVIDRYGPIYVEIWNEPDFGGSKYYQYFGCVANGNLYGKFVKHIYQRVKGAFIIMGAVMIITDPFSADCIKAADGNFDGFSYHYYGNIRNNQLVDDVRDWQKIAMGLTDKPCFMSEGAVLVKDSLTTLERFHELQIVHYDRIVEIPTVKFWYTVGFNGWPQGPFNSDLCGRDENRVIYPRPVWLERYSKSNGRT